MMRTNHERSALAGSVLAGLMGCGGPQHEVVLDERPGTVGDAAGGTETTDAEGDSDGGGSRFDAGSDPTGPGAAECVPPDVLVVLDRSQSMFRTPAGDSPTPDLAGYQTSRWWIALRALQSLSLQFEQGVAFGLELFPAVDPSTCVTLPERVSGIGASGDGCFTAEQVFAPALGNAAAFEAALDPLTTLLCNQTPMATAIQQASVALAAAASDDHDQHVLLVTDGAESCNGDYTTQVQQLVATTGAKVYVVAFGDTALTEAHEGLNRMACAGLTAPDFDLHCTDGGSGSYDAIDPTGPTLYIAAQDEQTLVGAFEALAVELCCGASCPAG